MGLRIAHFLSTAFCGCEEMASDRDLASRTAARKSLMRFALVPQSGLAKLAA